MNWKDLWWSGVLISVTAAYLLSLAGIHAAKRHHVANHARLMLTACTLVGLWLVVYVTKQVVFGRDRFGGTPEQYWGLYVPVLSLHTGLAVVTICLGLYNLYTGLYTGLTRPRRGTGVEARVAGVARHRRIGHVLLWTFTGTMATAYVVYAMLFVWFPAT